MFFPSLMLLILGHVAFIKSSLFVVFFLLCRTNRWYGVLVFITSPRKMMDLWATQIQVLCRCNETCHRNTNHRKEKKIHLMRWILVKSRIEKSPWQKKTHIVNHSGYCKFFMLSRNYVCLTVFGTNQTFHRIGRNRNASYLKYSKLLFNVC